MKDNIIGIVVIIFVAFTIIVGISNCAAGDKYKGSEARWQELSARIR